MKSKIYLPSRTPQKLHLQMADGEEVTVRPRVKACSFYLEGRCRFGAQCRNLHPSGDRECLQGAETLPTGTETGAERPPTGTETGAERPPTGTEAGAQTPPTGTETGVKRPPTGTEAGIEKPARRAVGAKKPPMRTAGEVVSRLRWDTELCPEEFTIGYLDRFVGLVEQPFGAFSWEDLASAEQGALAVPEHRIQYFKHRGRTVWDKTRRLDDVFGSTGGGRTIRELLGAAGQQGDAQDGVRRGDAQDGGRHGDAQDGGQYGDAQDGGQYGDAQHGGQHDGVKDCNLDDRVIGDDVRGYNIIGAHDITHCDDDGAQGDQACSLGLPPSPGSRPNYFVAARITSKEFQLATRELQARLTEALPDFGGCCVPLSRLHLTLCPLRLDHLAQLEAARSALRQLGWEGRRLLPPALLLDFGELQDFGGRVLYTSPRGSGLAQLGRLAEELGRRFRELGLCVLGPQDRPSGGVPLHVTLAKLSRSYSRQHPGVRLLPELYREWPQPQFGCQALEALSLCETRGVGGTEGFYSTVLLVSLY
ncbi:leukocyte receptor cluster member 9-like isoform X1 [Heterodontus francisci]|uniref:leukocyte receptor cluster member 9-like isoform X1 n=2 Tax=Heterodontus francisci TaxID=7792 RepID=UPI00355B85DC